MPPIWTRRLSQWAKHWWCRAVSSTKHSCLNMPFLRTTFVFSIHRVRTDRYCTRVSQFINKRVRNLEICTRLKCLILCKTFIFLISFYEFNRYICNVIANTFGVTYISAKVFSCPLWKICRFFKKEGLRIFFQLVH